ncbi:MAG: 3-deoxy-7-phosphoheptulonate synthase [Lentisphaeria bacterium]|nr:3-deoxy-7-phosphoheptulonate synthase [Lentisphaeria bacterium]
MIIVLHKGLSDIEIEKVCSDVEQAGYQPKIIRGVEEVVLACVGDEQSHSSLEALTWLPEVERVLPVQKKYKLVSRDFKPEDSTFLVHHTPFGGKNFSTIAGPCSIESLDQCRKTAEMLKNCGINTFRGGAFKPRTSPYAFQGLAEEGLKILAKIKEEFDMGIVTEVLGVEHIDATAEVADMIQIGARNCQNYHLLEKVAKAGTPVLLKRGLATTIDEWLLAAEYIIYHGTNEVMLCERGIRTYETATRFTLDVAAIAVALRESHLPIIVDPSHPAGHVNYVQPLARAGIAAGAHGMIVETHPCPSKAVSDAAQQIAVDKFSGFYDDLRPWIDLRKML